LDLRPAQWRLIDNDGAAQTSTLPADLVLALFPREGLEIRCLPRWGVAGGGILQFLQKARA